MSIIFITIDDSVMEKTKSTNGLYVVITLDLCIVLKWTVFLNLE